MTSACDRSSSTWVMAHRLLELWPFIAYLYAQHALHSGDAPAALARLDSVQAAYDEGQFTKGAVTALMCRAKADLLIACGRREKAKQLLAAQGSKKPLNRVPSARIRLLSGLCTGAEIDSLTWDPATSTRDRIEMLLLGAVAALRGEDLGNAQRLVNQALDLYGETGHPPAVRRRSHTRIAQGSSSSPSVTWSRPTRRCSPGRHRSIRKASSSWT